MDISIGSYKCRLEILLLIVVVFWIMFGHVLCACSRVNLMEAFTGNKHIINDKPKFLLSDNFSNIANSSSENVKEVKNLIPESARGHILGIGTKPGVATEGFVGSNNTASGPDFAGAKTASYIMNPSTWSMPTLTYSPGSTPDAGIKAVWDRPKQPIPLPDGELDIFATTQFAPECCPNAYSSSTGCACMTTDQYNYLRTRGSNNVPYSEY